MDFNLYPLQWMYYWEVLNKLETKNYKMKILFLTAVIGFVYTEVVPLSEVEEVKVWSNCVSAFCYISQFDDHVVTQ